MLQSIRDLRSPYQFKIDSVDTYLNYIRPCGIDYNVFLPSIGKNLQRPFCWSLDQKRELINSVLVGRSIRRFSFIIKLNDSYEVIDGKQRLSTLYSFLDNEFTIILEGEEYLFSDLPKDYQVQFDRLLIRFDKQKVI